MNLKSFLTEYENWKELLSEAPYYLKIKEEGEYILFKYSQTESDFSYQEVCEARGSILKRTEAGWVYVCRPFDKFFNYGESYAAKIDWESASVTEKIDGSLMKIWYDNGEWHLSTNGCIDAFKAIVESSNSELSFGQLFNEALGENFSTFAEKNLHKDLTFMFELVSPESQVVIPYKKKQIYFLAARNPETGEYYNSWNNLFVCPKSFDLKSLKDTLEVVNSMTRDEEGVVVCDKYGNRIKVKSPEYLIAAHLVGNKKLTAKVFAKMLKADEIDDYLAYCSDHNKEKINYFLERLEEEKYLAEFSYDWILTIKNLNRKEYAEAAKIQKYFCFLMKKYDNKNLTFIDWFKSLPAKTIAKYLAESEDT